MPTRTQPGAWRMVVASDAGSNRSIRQIEQMQNDSARAVLVVAASRATNLSADTDGRFGYRAHDSAT